MSDKNLKTNKTALTGAGVQEDRGFKITMVLGNARMP